MDSMKYRSVFLSDIHLETHFCQYEKLLDFLKSLETSTGYDIENLFLVGDIIDMIQMNHSIFWGKHRTVIKKLLRMADKGVNIYLIPGNHDYYIRTELKDIPENMGNIHIYDKIIYIAKNNNKYLIIHGDQFDGAIRSMPWLYWLGDKAYNFANMINYGYNGIRKLCGLKYWSLSLYLKSNIKNVIKFINNYEDIVIEKAKNEGCTGIICGHIHKAEDKMINNIHYLNCGTWVEFCSAIVEHPNGTMQSIII
jgi:UDP-2,3-diacylglucosamine pyrophosphatase LpxH